CVHVECFGHYKKWCRCRCNCCVHCHSTHAAADPSGVHEYDPSIAPPHRVRHVLSGASLGSSAVPCAGLRLQYSSLTQRGYYPGWPDRANQDSFYVKTQFQGNPDLHFFGVFDGHGDLGAQCSAFVRDRLTDILAGDPRLWENTTEAYRSAFAATNMALHDSEIDDSSSGTTAITVLVRGDTLVVANVGDSRAVAGVWDGDRVVAEDLSSDHKPLREDERERLRQYGAMVSGEEDPDERSLSDDEETYIPNTPRLWGRDFGLALSRSFGDSDLESVGLIAVPELKVVKLTANHSFFVVASDGVFDFLSSQAVVDMVSCFADPRDACSAIAARSYQSWLRHGRRHGRRLGRRTDDITIIIVQLKDLAEGDSTT
ncbi:unnamed protein product, partial [Musa banksii]